MLTNELLRHLLGSYRMHSAGIHEWLIEWPEKSERHLLVGDIKESHWFSAAVARIHVDRMGWYLEAFPTDDRYSDEMLRMRRRKYTGYVVPHSVLSGQDPPKPLAALLRDSPGYQERHIREAARHLPEVIEHFAPRLQRFYMYSNPLP